MDHNSPEIGFLIYDQLIFFKDLFIWERDRAQRGGAEGEGEA